MSDARSAAADRRSFICMGAGALAGLLMAGYALFTARGTSTLLVPPEDVALVNQQPISRVDFLQQLQTLYGVDLGHATPQQRRRVLDDMIREELFVQRGKELDVAAADPDVRSAMVGAVEQEIAADALTSQPGEAQLRAYFDTHRSRYASEGVMNVRDYVFPAGAADDAARAARAMSAAPPTAELLAGLHGADSHKVGEQEFYFAAKIHLGEKLFAAARALPDRGTSAPLAYGGSLHVIYMLENRRPVPFDFAAARQQVLTDYRNDAIGHLRLGDETFLRRRANILIADDVK